MTAKSYTEEEIREIAERQNLVGYPHLALMREKLSVKAKNEPKFRFYNLKRLVVETETLKCAWAQVRANKGAPGVDGVTIEDIEQSEGGAEAFIAGIQKELHEKTYRASPVRRKYIEKANGKLRPLGIPTVKDRVVQCAVKLIIEPIFEADFHDCSFGFRPNRSAQQAVDRIAAEIKSGKRQGYDADLSSYFDTIPRKLILPVEGVVKRLNLVLDGWGRYFKCGYPSRQFAKVNAYAQYRLYKFLNRKSQRRYRLKYAETYYGELQKLGLIALTRRRYR